METSAPAHDYLKEVLMAKEIGVPLRRPAYTAFTFDPKYPLPGFNWQPSEETLNTLKVIEDNQRAAFALAPFICVD